MTASTLRTPSACAPSSTDSSPITVVSRGVTWGIVSIPQLRSIATAAISAFIRARAIGLSLMSTKPTLPDSASRRATASIASLLPPCGGSSSTETTHSPSRRARARPVSPCAAGAVGARSRWASTGGVVGARSTATASAIAAICAGVVPQQPPMMRAPRARAWAANSPK